MSDESGGVAIWSWTQQSNGWLTESGLNAWGQPNKPPIHKSTVSHPPGKSDQSSGEVLGLLQSCDFPQKHFNLGSSSECLGTPHRHRKSRSNLRRQKLQEAPARRLDLREPEKGKTSSKSRCQSRRSPLGTADEGVLEPLGSRPEHHTRSWAGPPPSEVGFISASRARCRRTKREEIGAKAS